MRKNPYQHIDLRVNDLEEAWEFYSKLFGWQKTDEMDMGEGHIYMMYGRGAFPLGGMYNKTPDMPGPPGWLFYIGVEDVNASAEQINKLGGQVVMGPREIPGGDLIAVCVDPQGGVFAVHSTAAN